VSSSIEFAEDTGRLISISAEDENKGIKVTDHIERRQCWIETATSVVPKRISTEKFDFPVDSGSSIITNEISIPHSVGVYIRNQAGIMICELTKGERKTLPSGYYSIEISSPIKLYIIVQDELDIQVTSESATISFGEMTEIYIGARSHHKRPAAKITTTPDPDDMMRAVSYLASSLKTTTCERSYPTLRGHPPEIDVGEKTKIPDILKLPQTGIKIEVPKNYRHIYIVSPLVYYIGGELTQGKEPKIKTEEGFECELYTDDLGFEKRVQQILKQCFFLDCITRTEGYYQVNLYEREKIKEKTNIDFSTLYKKPIKEQIREYLQIPYDAIEPHLPQWKLTAHIETDASNISILPFLINDLASIRSAKQTVIKRSKDGSLGSNIDQISNSILDIRKKINPHSKNSLLNSSATRDLSQTTDVGDLVRIERNESLEQTWVGDGIPVGASKAMIRAFRNRLQRNPTDGDIIITVIVNDEEMASEGNIVDKVYASREQLPFDVEVHQRLKTKELETILRQDIDFLHYIGHIDDEGFECTNGQLDVTEINETGVDAFLLNACSSYKQAVGLINIGAVAGIATIRPVLNSGAERIGRAIARLLNLGFSFIASLEISKIESVMGENYVLIGDGGLDLTQSKGGIPSLSKIHRENGLNKVEYRTYSTRRKNIGSMTIPYAKNNKKYFLTSGHTGEFKMNDDDLIEFLSMGEMPVITESNLYWSDENGILKRLDII